MKIFFFLLFYSKLRPFDRSSFDRSGFTCCLLDMRYRIWIWRRGCLLILVGRPLSKDFAKGCELFAHDTRVRSPSWSPTSSLPRAQTLDTYESRRVLEGRAVLYSNSSSWPHGVEPALLPPGNFPRHPDREISEVRFIYRFLSLSSGSSSVREQSAWEKEEDRWLLSVIRRVLTDCRRFVDLDLILNSPNFLVYLHSSRKGSSKNLVRILYKFCKEKGNTLLQFSKIIVRDLEYLSGFPRLSKSFPEKIFAFSVEGKERAGARFCVGSLECWNGWRKAARKPIRLVAFAAYGGGQSYK